MYDNFSPKNNTLDNLLAGKQASPRQDKRKHRFHLGNGAALILVALMIISLLCFAALSIVIGAVLLSVMMPMAGIISSIL